LTIGIFTEHKDDENNLFPSIQSIQTINL